MHVALCPLFLIVLVALPALAQTTASLSGTVSDPAGNPVAGARVLLEN